MPDDFPTEMAFIRPVDVKAALMVAVGGCGLLVAGERAEAQEKVATIRAVEGLRFDPPRLVVAPAQEVRLRFENADTTAQPHNLLVVRPGSRESVVAAALALGAEGPSSGYVPAGPDVIAASRLLTAGDGEDLILRMPDAPGIYPIVCTFPGHGAIMFGALYAGVEMPRREEDDPHVPKPLPVPPIDPDPRPMVRRIFLPNASPAAIAVALPGDLNLCWDAGPCRLRYAWRGGFLSVDTHFEGKGQAMPQLGGPVVFTAPSVFPVRLGGRVPKAVAFRGYVVDRGLPVFEYIVDGEIVKEGFYTDAGVLVRRFHFGKPRTHIEIHVGVWPAGSVSASHGTLVDGVLRLTTPDDATDVEIRYTLPSTSAPPSTSE